MSYGIDEVDLIFEEMNEKYAKTLHNFSQRTQIHSRRPRQSSYT